MFKWILVYVLLIMCYLLVFILNARQRGRNELFLQFPKLVCI